MVSSLNFVFITAGLKTFPIFKNALFNSNSKLIYFLVGVKVILLPGSAEFTWDWMDQNLIVWMTGLLSFTLILISPEVFYPILINYTLNMLLAKEVSLQFQSSIYFRILIFRQLKEASCPQSWSSQDLESFWYLMKGKYRRAHATKVIFQVHWWQQLS